MNNVLVLSNNAVSNTESNGRIHSYFVKDFIPGRLHNFYARGIPDVEGVKYLSVAPKKALLSKLSFGLLNANFNAENGGANGSSKASPKSKKVFYHLVRSFAYLNNRRIIKNLSQYIIKNNIDTIYLWGCNVPFLYNYAQKLAKKNNIDLITFTGEDYPLKDYNYISFKKSLFFKKFQCRFRKENNKVYLLSKLNYFANEELKELYETKLNIKGEISYFKSILEKSDRKISKISKILYAGNLYKERANSLCEIADFLVNISDATIFVYGNCSGEIKEKINACKNIIYKGVVDYQTVLKEIYDSDLLLHLEGFTDDYVKDCKYAFSTKISDYLLTGIPMFVYGSKDISGIRFCLNLMPDFVAIKKDELAKLEDIINFKKQYNLDYKIIQKSFKV